MKNIKYKILLISSLRIFYRKPACRGQAFLRKHTHCGLRVNSFFVVIRSRDAPGSQLKLLHILNVLDDCFESLRMVHGKVCQYFLVQGYAFFIHFAHEFGV